MTEDYEKRIREKIFNSRILTDGEWVYLVGLFQIAREYEDLLAEQKLSPLRPAGSVDLYGAPRAEE